MTPTPLPNSEVVMRDAARQHGLAAAALDQVLFQIAPALMLRPAPLSTVVEVALPPDWTFSTPVADTVVLIVAPLASTVSVAPPSIVVLVTTPPEETTSVPPLSRCTPFHRPPEVTETTPPLDTVVASALPPANTEKMAPLLMIVPLAIPPDSMSSVTPLPTETLSSCEAGEDLDGAARVDVGVAADLGAARTAAACRRC